MFRLQCHLLGYSDKAGTVKLTCPGNGTDINKTSGFHESNQDFVILAHENSIDVLIVEDDTLLPCSHTLSIPSPTIAGFSGGILLQNDIDLTPVICGGTANKLCYSLELDDYNQPPVLGTLKSSRIGSASLVIDNGASLWITGGFDFDSQQTLGTTEFVELNNTWLNSSNGPHLPSDGLQYHCLETIDSNLAILIGGQDRRNKSDKFSWIVNFDTMTWEFAGSLTRRRYQHACGVLRDLTLSGKRFVIATGGVTVAHTVTRSVELLLLEDNGEGLAFNNLTWEFGPDLPMPMTKLESVTTFDQKAMFVIGEIIEDNGVNSQFESQLAAFRLQCFDLQCSWINMKHALKGHSNKGLALIVPPTFASHRGIVSKECDFSERGSIFVQTFFFAYIYCCVSDDTIFLLSTGWNGIDTVSDTDIISTSTLTRCYHAEFHLPEALDDATGGLLAPSIQDEKSSRKYSAIICGELACYILGSSKVAGSLNHPRYGASSVTINSGKTLWVTGGYDGTYDLDTTELVEFDDFSESILVATVGRTLPEPMSFHCLEVVDNTLGILYGGNQFGVEMSASWTLDLVHNVNDNDWVPRAPMSMARMHHACGVVSQFVVAAGGMLSNGDITDNVELFDAGSEKSWSQGPALPVPLQGAASVTKEDNSQLFVVGGALSNDWFHTSNAVYAFECLDKVCQWSCLDVVLLYARSSAVAFMLPLETNKDSSSPSSHSPSTTDTHKESEIGTTTLTTEGTEFLGK